MNFVLIFATLAASATLVFGHGSGSYAKNNVKPGAQGINPHTVVGLPPAEVDKAISNHAMTRSRGK